MLANLWSITRLKFSHQTSLTMPSPHVDLCMLGFLAVLLVYEYLPRLVYQVITFYVFRANQAQALRALGREESGELYRVAVR